MKDAPMPTPEQPSAKPELLPCSICGGGAKIEKYFYEDTQYLFICKNCGIRSMPENSEAKAIAIWNAKHDKASPPTPLDKPMSFEEWYGNTYANPLIGSPNDQVLNRVFKERLEAAWQAATAAKEDEINDIETAFEPVKYWYEGEGNRSLSAMVQDAVEDLRNDRAENIKMRNQIKALVSIGDQMQAEVCNTRLSNKWDEAKDNL